MGDQWQKEWVFRSGFSDSKRRMKDGKPSKLLPTKLLLVTPCASDHTPQSIADQPGPLYVMSLLRASGL